MKGEVMRSVFLTFLEVEKPKSEWRGCSSSSSLRISYKMGRNNASGAYSFGVVVDV
jgi:hypothetical protein